LLDIPGEETNNSLLIDAPKTLPETWVSHSKISSETCQEHHAGGDPKGIVRCGSCQMLAEPEKKHRVEKKTLWLNIVEHSKKSTETTNH
jgi:hypothetical protein